MKKIINIYKKNNTYYIHNSIQDLDGIWNACEPVLALSNTEPFRFDSFFEDDPISNNDSDAAMNTLYKLSKSKSWTTFVNGCKCVTVEISDNDIIILPFNNLGPHEGFDPINDQALTITDYHSKLSDVYDEIQKKFLVSH